ncbi:glycosyltransferase family 2 protein [Clostridium chrysemydis]|uniref:glycosyltransferase family 2 protein n=1 Tax=Clostridium chrysemydis TaxID=2665504 RepID=UPI0018839BEB|nr:glycosyltransferase [Clostridium chrysemydis]
MGMKVSIIVPVYNGEKYIKRAIYSTINQEYKDLEIIIINDGSTDNTLKIIKNIEDKRIRIINKKNTGVSNSRNIGLDNATGDFVMFLDADDYLDSKIVLKLMRYAMPKTMVFCDNYEVFKNKTDIRKVFGKNEKEIAKKDILREITKGNLGLVCSKLIHIDIIKNNKIRFDENLKLSEDQLFFLEIASKCEKFKYIKESLYYYDRRNELSATNSYKKNLLKNYLLLQDKTENILKNEFKIEDKEKNILNEKLFNSFKEVLRNEVAELKIKDYKNRFKNIGELISEVGKRIDFNYVTGSNILYREMLKCIRRDTVINRFRLIVFMKILILKNG